MTPKYALRLCERGEAIQACFMDCFVPRNDAKRVRDARKMLITPDVKSILPYRQAAYQ